MTAALSRAVVHSQAVTDIVRGVGLDVLADAARRGGPLGDGTG